MNAYAASSFYAVDRYASYRQDWGRDYEHGGLILADRYTTSNAVHQGAKVPPQEREDFFRWLYEYEYGRLGLPKPDLVCYLDMPTELALSLLRSREERTHTQADIHERDGAYLAECRRCALSAANVLGWTVIPCAAGGAPRGVEEIEQDIWSAVSRALG